MKPFKKFWKSVTVLFVLVGMTFLFNLPGLMKCHGEVDSTSQSEYSSIDSEPIIEVGLAQASE
ncbi:MAG: hypothetical protein ACRENT_01210 [Thermodesulfobacteriota bacterium]